MAIRQRKRHRQRPPNPQRLPQRLRARPPKRRPSQGLWERHPSARHHPRDPQQGRAPSRREGTPRAARARPQRSHQYRGEQARGSQVEEGVHDGMIEKALEMLSSQRVAGAGAGEECGSETATPVTGRRRGQADSRAREHAWTGLLRRRVRRVRR
ncbi:hypothetical protein DID88_005135 [Monilinia fructigena]|uniref:Uncharacterized protein n=1 Tax=Monilinia fructigena TaxID=38457 RepID=A0A395IE04_9HELO|nr:hypothetical protein DID88_005135 [Monilinia fructigena]